jgi:SAM-dependent methyltransferase
MSFKKLNLGSGQFKKKGYINMDWHSLSEPDILHDLNIVPYPFGDNEFDLIEADHVLEHLEDVFKITKELHRISKNGARIIIKVPHFSRGFSHPEHKRGFDFSFPLYFNKDFQGGYQGLDFDLEKIKLTWFAQKYLKKITISKPLYLTACFFDKIFNFFANLSPVVCSRLWCFWVGGFEEIKFAMIVKK